MPTRSNLLPETVSIQTHLGATVRRCRRQMGITQQELASRADLHRTYIADVERGGRNLTLRSIVNLAAALETSIEHLLGQPGATAGGGEAVSRASFDHGIGEILLVEDDPADAELTLQAFRRARFTNPITLARDGEEAIDYLFRGGLDALRRNPPLPQLILLDLNVPKISGLEVLRQIKDHERTRDIPVVVLTGSRQDKDILECSRLGASTIIKPVSFESFCKATRAMRLEWALLGPVGTRRDDVAR